MPVTHLLSWFYRSPEELPPQISDLICPTCRQQSGIPDVHQLLSFCHASVTVGKRVHPFLLSSFSHRCTDNGSHFLLAFSLTHSHFTFVPSDILTPRSPSVPPPVQLCIPVLFLTRLKSISGLLMCLPDLNAPQHLSAFLSS